MIKKIIDNMREICDIVKNFDDAYIYLHTIDEEKVSELLKNGYDVEIGAFIIPDDDQFEVRISCKKKEKGNYSNPIETFYKLVDEGKIVVVEEEYGIWINIPGQQSYFYQCYEDLFYQSACSNVKRLIDKVII